MCHIAELSAVQVVFGSKLGKMCHFLELKCKLCSASSRKCIIFPISAVKLVFGPKLGKMCHFLELSAVQVVFRF